MTTLVHLQPEMLGAIMEMSVELGFPAIQAVLRTYHDGAITVTAADLAVLKEYLERTQAHYSERFPHHDADGDLYDPDQEDAYLEALDIYRNPLAYALGDAFGEDVLIT